jgi:hypothetical protein
MKRDELKSYFILKSIRPVMIVLIAIIICVFVKFSQSFFYNKNSEYKVQNQNLETQISKLTNDVEKAKSSFLVWQKIKDKNFDTVGLRINVAKKIIDDLRQLYLINNLDVNLSNPVVRKDIIKETVGLEYSDFIITFQSYSDTEIFKFIDGLNKKMPGILHYAYINMRALDVDIDDAMLDNIRKGGYKDLVQARLIMNWQDFKNLKDKNVQKINK